MMRKFVMLASLGLACVGLAACEPAKPEGQALALVNGVPVTSGEVALELSLIPPEQRGGARARVIEELIERKLLVEEARARGLDTSAQFVAAERRNRELLLAQFASDVAAAGMAAPSNAQDQALAAQRRAAALAQHNAALRAGARILLAKDAAKN
jgi:peptidyl-prolyl cis-trans isomerase C